MDRQRDRSLYLYVDTFEDIETKRQTLILLDSLIPQHQTSNSLLYLIINISKSFSPAPVCSHATGCVRQQSARARAYPQSRGHAGNWSATAPQQSLHVTTAGINTALATHHEGMLLFVSWGFYCNHCSILQPQSHMCTSTTREETGAELNTTRILGTIERHFGMDVQRSILGDSPLH